MMVLSAAIHYKSGAIFISSFIFGFITSFFEPTFFGISYTYLLLAFFLIAADFFTGTIAYRYEHRGKAGWLQSSKLSFTIYKIISILLLLWIFNEINNSIKEAIELSDAGAITGILNSATGFVSICRATIFTLICGREYISIGENIQRRFGKQFYAFAIFEKLFDFIELKFIKKLKA